MPSSVRDRPTKSHEQLFLLTKNSRYYYDTDAIAEPSVESGTRNKRTVWTIAPRPFREAHFATFPPALIKPCILAGSAVGDTVLDPFAGSGTTGLVALRFGRSFIGMELNPKYVEMAQRRIKLDKNFNVEYGKTHEPTPTRNPETSSVHNPQLQNGGPMTEQEQAEPKKRTRSPLPPLAGPALDQLNMIRQALAVVVSKIDISKEVPAAYIVAAVKETVSAALAKRKSNPLERQKQKLAARLAAIQAEIAALSAQK